VNRTREHAVSQDDVNVMVTLANQVAIALDNTDAYHQIELLNVGLEARVRERTTQLETANDQLKEANEQLTEMDRLKSEFVAHVSHELRTPLTSICGFTDNILEGLAGPLTAKQEQNLTRVKANVVRLTRMIAQLLEQTRMEAGKIDLMLQEVPLIGLAGEVVEQLRPIARSKHQQLILAEAPEDLRVWGDTDRLTQILTNLVDNALKYTPDGGSVTVRLARAGPHFAKVSVTDTGVGIPADEVPQLFDRFFRSRRHRQGHIKGLGLGLAIVKHLVELHGGVIAVKSQEGKGTEVRFTLPLRQTLERKDASPTATKRILVVDDDADIRDLLRDRLTSDGYLVDTGVDGRAALELLRKTPFDGLILDINMPHVDGLEVLHWVRECQPTMPVIMITAAEARERAVLAMEAGAQAYLLKPFDSKQLRDVVNCWF
jgi:signal transduction histidine kinase